MTAVRDILSADHPAAIPGNAAVAVLILAALVGRVAISGPAGLALLAAACVLAAAVPFAGVLAISVSLWTLPLLKMPAVVSDIRPDELVLLASLAGAVLVVLARRDLRETGVERGFAVFLMATVASVGLRYAVGSTVSLRAVALPLAGQALHLFLFILVVWTVRCRPGRSIAVAVALALGAVMSSVLGIAQYFSGAVHSFIVRVYPTLDGGSKYPYAPGGSGFRSMSAFDGNPNHFGVALVMMALFSAAMAERSSDRRSRAAWGGVSLLTLSAILFTTSRTAFLAAFVVLVVGAIVFRSRLLAAVTAAWITLTLVLPSEMSGRLLDLLGTRTAAGVVPDPSVAGRIGRWAEQASGPTTIILPINDNFYLDLFRNYGPLALAGFVWLMWVVGSRLVRAVRDHPAAPGYLLGALAAWCALAAASFAGGFFATQRVAELCWILVGLAVAQIVVEAQSARAKVAEPSR
jgi:hypothetical protein